MIGPLQNINSIGTVQAVDGISRSELINSNSQNSVELPNLAVGNVVKVQNLQPEIPPHLHDFAENLEKIKKDYKLIEEKAQRAKEIQALRDRLLTSKSSVGSANYDAHKVHDALNAADLFLSKINDPVLIKDPKHQSQNANLSNSTTQTTQDKNKKDISAAGIEDQQAVLLRIEEALDALSKLMNRMNEDTQMSSSNILSLSGSIAGLNSARSTVDKSNLSLSVATNTVDLIMTNIKTAIVSHGNVSSDLVRLVLV